MTSPLRRKRRITPRNSKPPTPSDRHAPGAAARLVPAARHVAIGLLTLAAAVAFPALTLAGDNAPQAAAPQAPAAPSAGGWATVDQTHGSHLRWRPCRPAHSAAAARPAERVESHSLRAVRKPATRSPLPMPTDRSAMRPGEEPEAARRSRSPSGGRRSAGQSVRRPTEESDRVARPCDAHADVARLESARRGLAGRQLAGRQLAGVGAGRPSAEQSVRPCANEPRLSGRPDAGASPDAHSEPQSAGQREHHDEQGQLR